MDREYKGVFVFAEQKNGTIHNVSYELLAKGRELADKLNVEVYCGVLGPENMNVQELIYKGADKIYYVEDKEIFNFPEEMIYVENITKIINEIKPEICLFGATTFGRSIAPRIAAKMKTGLTADCTGLEIDTDGKLIQIRPAFSENILAQIKSKCMPQMATVRYKEFDKAENDINRTGEVLVIEPSYLNKELVKIIEEITKEEVNITDANVVVAAGKGLKNPDDFKMLEELANLLGGVVGASRPLVEEGFISKAHQVGYSGNRVKAKLYIACGISGAPQHIAGMKDSEIILAINSDPSAPIFGIANYGIVGDLYEVIPSLIKSIKNKKIKVA